jgi:HAD superfamily hydrolase (TIGR01456 family)
MSNRIRRQLQGRNISSPQSSPLLSNKLLKETQNIIKVKSKHHEQEKKPRFGICFDVDGVLARGTLALPQAERAMKLLHDEHGNMKAPITYVTNSLNRDQDKANQISNWFGINVSPSQMISAQGPLAIFKDFHDKHCLLIGQGKILDIAKDLGFTNICTLDQIQDAYPLLDMVDHENRKKIARDGYKEKEFPRIEAVILLGEPQRWESSLQLLIDLLQTDGKPDRVPEAIPEQHLPVIACNMDLQFMDRACMPRYGHGAYLTCLEALYLKVTGKELQYTALVGKPGEITFRYAEHILTKQAKKMGLEESLDMMYMIGDTPEADIVGSNLYQSYLDRLQMRRNVQNESEDMSKENKYVESMDPELPESRNVPRRTSLHPSTVRECCSILVCTGVYKPSQESSHSEGEKPYQGHRDFPANPDLQKPVTTKQDVEEAVQYILKREKADW